MLLDIANEDLHLYHDLPHDENFELTTLNSEEEENSDDTAQKIVKTIYTYGPKSRDKDELFSHNVTISHRELALNLCVSKFGSSFALFFCLFSSQPPFFFASITQFLL